MRSRSGERRGGGAAADAESQCPAPCGARGFGGQKRPHADTPSSPNYVSFTVQPSKLPLSPTRDLSGLSRGHYVCIVTMTEKVTRSSSSASTSPAVCLFCPYEPSLHTVNSEYYLHCEPEGGNKYPSVSRKPKLYVHTNSYLKYPYWFALPRSSS